MTAMAGTKKKPAGLPRYRPEFAAQAEKLCAIGATVVQLGEFFEVDTRTILRWQADKPEFARALREGRKRADDTVERSLYRRAIGYTREAARVLLAKDGRSPVLVPYEEQVPPDTRAAQAWLKMRCPDLREHRDARGKKAPAPEPEKTVIILPDNGRD
jgi:hypothetical protein